MAHTITAADANRMFSALLRQVRSGRGVTITSHGKPVARLVPIDAAGAGRAAARRALFRRLAATRPVRAGRWTREELYED